MAKSFIYYCQSCNHQEESKKLLHGTSCPKCKTGAMDDWPKDAVMGEDPIKDEQSLAHFDRYIAGDR